MPKDEPVEVSANFDVLKELERCEEILQRDIKNIYVESSRGKLSEKSSRDLVAYMKLLREGADEQKEKIKDVKTEDLEKLVKDPLD